VAKKTIADVNIKLSAGTSGLQADFQKAAGLAKGFGADVMGIATKIGGALAGAFAVGSIASGVRKQMQSIDAIAKTADQIGASIAQVQALNLAADLAGVGVSDLAGGFRKMSATVTDAAAGSETAAASLARVGLSAQALAGMSPVQQLAAVIEALQGVGDATERLSLAQDLLGRSGQVFLSLDAAQIRAAADDVDRLGLAMTRADAAKVEEANDAITRMTASVTALYQELAIGLAPVITSVADSITDLVSWVSNLDSATVTNTIKLSAFAAGFAGVLVLIPRIVAGVRSIIVTLQALASAQAITNALAGPAGWAKLAVAAGVAAIGVAGVTMAFDGVAKSADKATAKATATGKATTNSMQAAAAAASEAADQVGRVGSGFDAVRSKADQITREMQTPMEKYDADMGELQKLWDQRLISPETQERAQKKYGEDLEKALETQEQITNLQSVGTQGVGAVQAGTSAAFSAVQAASREQREMLAAEKATAAASKQANEHLKQIANNTKAGGVTIGKAEIK
jgi:hypothetical protein